MARLSPIGSGQLTRRFLPGVPTRLVLESRGLQVCLPAARLTHRNARRR